MGNDEREVREVSDNMYKLQTPAPLLLSNFEVSIGSSIFPVLFST